jgi:hypothetical protein
MNKLKNIGISALAGTLVSLSAAQAGGAISVGGSYELSYTQLDHDEVSGNKLGINKNLSFGAGGDISDGGAVTWATTIAMTDGFSGLSSASMSINMGGIATLTYDSGTGGTGANAVDNIMPTAWEEVDYGFATGISDVGAVSGTKGVVTLAVKAPVAGTGFSVSYAARMNQGHVSDGAVSGGPGEAGYKGIDVVIDVVDYNAAHAGFRWGIAAQTELMQVTCTRNNEQMRDTQDNTVHRGTSVASCNDGFKHNPYAGTMYTKLQLGPIHLGTQATFKNHATTKASAIMNTRSIVGGVAAVFGDTLSFSYGVGYDKYRYNDRNRNTTANQANCGNTRHCVEKGASMYEYESQKYSGYSAALNVGPVALKATSNKVHARGDGRSNAVYKMGDTHSELNLSIAF